MRLRAAVIVAALLVVPGMARAQGTTAPLPLTKAIVQKLVPLLQAEKAGAKDTLVARLAAAGMTRATYGAYKNAIVIAKLDMADQGRLQRQKIGVAIRLTNIKIIKEATDSGIDFSDQHVGDTITPCGALCMLGR